MSFTKSNKMLVISRKDARELLDLRELIDKMREAYVDRVASQPVQPQRAVARLGQDSIVINFPGELPGNKAYTVKTNIKMAGNADVGLPFVMGAILMLDCETGRPLSVLESSLITSMRTCASGAVGAEALARTDSNRVALIGAGALGAWQLRALRVVDRIQSACVYDISTQRAVELAALLTAEIGIPVKAATTIRETVDQADIIVTATQSVVPIITANCVMDGIHINAFGADEPGKVEIDTEVLLNSRVVVDDRNLALTDGTLNVASKKGQAGPDSIHAEIGEVLAGVLPGRETDKQVTVFGGVGLAFQDLVACTLIYDKAVERGLGTWVNLI